MMLEPVKYNLDLTGSSPENKIHNETHVTDSSKKQKVIVLLNGPFYTESLVIRERYSGIELIRNKDYKPALMLAGPTEKSGKEVCSYIVVTNDLLGHEFLIDYQAVGGLFGYAVEPINELLNSLEIDNRAYDFYSITDLPTGYKEARHFHDVGDAYGFNYLIYVLDKIRLAVLDNDEPAWIQLYNYLASVNQSLIDISTSINTAFNTHIANRKAHGLTPAILNAVTPALISSYRNQLNQSLTTVMNNLVQSIETLRVSLNTHASNKNNPHGYTLAELGGVTLTTINTIKNNGVNSLNAFTINADANKLGPRSGNNVITGTRLISSNSGAAGTELNVILGAENQSILRPQTNTQFLSLGSTVVADDLFIGYLADSTDGFQRNRLHIWNGGVEILNIDQTDRVVNLPEVQTYIQNNLRGRPSFNNYTIFVPVKVAGYYFRDNSEAGNLDEYFSYITPTIDIDTTFAYFAPSNLPSIQLTDTRLHIHSRANEIFVVSSVEIVNKAGLLTIRFTLDKHPNAPNYSITTWGQLVGQTSELGNVVINWNP